MKRILVHDFAGHPFAIDLSRALARRGHDTTHAFCGGVTTGRGALSPREGDPASLRIVDVSDSPFERYSPVRRLRGEVRYGRRCAELVRDVRPDVVLSANTPLLSQALLWRAARSQGARRVYWVQDFLGSGTRKVLARRSAVAGAVVGAPLERLETALLRRSDHAIVIADDFLDELRRRRLDVPASTIENWTPIHEVTLRPKATPWSAAQGLDATDVVLYSGTLGLKHDPEHLVALAQGLEGSGAVVLVVTEGAGREHLEARRAELGLSCLRLLDFVDYEVLPDLLGAADVCVVLLEREAGTFSVPSKVLSYLAAGRPIIAAMPRENLAARLIERVGAGIVVEPGDHAGLTLAAKELLADPARRAAMARDARAYAEATFDAEVVADRVEALLA